MGAELFASNSGLASSLEQEFATLDDFRSSFRALCLSPGENRRELHLSGLPGGSLAYVLSQVLSEVSSPLLVVSATDDEASSLSKDLGFFCRDRKVVHFPSYEASPFAPVMQDRRAVLERLTLLSELTDSASAAHAPIVVLSAGAFLRRLPSPSSLAGRVSKLEVLQEIDREDLVEKLVSNGYLRVPVAEDAGTFSVRGGILDIFSPMHEWPVRIELEDGLVASMRFFDIDNQRTQETVEDILLPPVRAYASDPQALEIAASRVRELCDSLNIPTAKAKALAADLGSGRLQSFSEAFEPAFLGELASIVDYFPKEVPVAWVNPPRIHRAMRELSGQLAAEREGFIAGGGIAYPLSSYLVSEDEVREALQPRATLAVHQVVVVGGGDASEDEKVLDSKSLVDGEGLPEHLENPEHSEVLRFGAQDQQLLELALRNQRQEKSREPSLKPLADQIGRWKDEGVCVWIGSRTVAQSDRLRTLLGGYGLKLQEPELQDSELQLRESGRSQQGASVLLDVKDLRSENQVGSLVGELSRGFVFPLEGIAFVTEDEIFGKRTQKRKRSKSKAKSAHTFLQDLRELQVGDYVVHVDHGIGCYLGIERKVLGQSQMDRLHGKEASFVEVLVIEYGGGKLYLPVTRLGQIQKYAGKEGSKPKLDKLGGQTFARTKARVRKTVHQIADKLLKLYAERAAQKRPPLETADQSFAEFEATFQFEETEDQSKAIDDVMGDLESEMPMDRLVCGDVGFGKTEVAIRAAFRVADAGRQVAVLCPTTVLAQQHYLTFANRLRDYPFRVEVLSRFVDRKKQTEVLQATKEGKVDILVGTHRLLSKDVHFRELGLLVVDEEQRFGVTHKERIKEIRSNVDVLTLSATPIPRTLQMAVGGLRDLSLIRTPPFDRRAVRTIVCRFDDQLLKEAIERELSRGGQVFFVYNRIEGLYERGDRLQKLLPNARIAVAHGQMSEKALEDIMTSFVDGEYDILCSTAIIESGLDIPRANTMIVDRADTFGLSQLYQLRGRVGRSKERAFCYLIAPPPARMTDESRYRLEALERFSTLGSGFQIATLDMEQRGAGDLLGAEQSGSVASVGIELFVHMLEDAMATLRGEEVVREVDPEINIDLEQYIPDDYIEEIGLRLSLYKRLSLVESSEEVVGIQEEIEDRFGAPPPPVRTLCRVMSLKPELRKLRILGCDATQKRVTLHLREDTPLEPAKVMALITKEPQAWHLSPDMKLRYKAPEDLDGDSVELTEHVLQVLSKL